MVKYILCWQIVIVIYQCNFKRFTLNNKLEFPSNSAVLKRKDITLRYYTYLICFLVKSFIHGAVSSLTKSSFNRKTIINVVVPGWRPSTAQPIAFSLIVMHCQWWITYAWRWVLLLITDLHFVCLMVGPTRLVLLERTIFWRLPWHLLQINQLSLNNGSLGVRRARRARWLRLIESALAHLLNLFHLDLNLPVINL